MVLDADEIERVLEATPKGVYRVFLTALTELGLREAECRGLRWEKIDWETDRISLPTSSVATDAASQGSRRPSRLARSF